MRYAFPNDYPSTESNGNKLPFTPGLTKRELFAAMALQGIHAAYANPGSSGLPNSHKAAKWAVEAADALIVELEREPTP